MEKICEFCLALRPMVFCKSDSAFLCLTCDSRVHSANALSSKHPRVLLCESCGDRAAFALCLDHRLILCKVCDGKLHQMNRGGGGSGDNNSGSKNNTSDVNDAATALCNNQHRKRMVGAFTGCPTAKQFAALWGIGASGGVASGGAASFDRCGDELNTEVNSSSNKLQVQQSSWIENQNEPQTSAAAKDSRKQQQSQLIMQQILGLKRLQLKDGSSSSSSPILIREHVNPSTSYFSSANLDGGSVDDDDDPLHCGLSRFSSEKQHERQEHLIGSQPLFEMDYMSTTTQSIYEGGADSLFWQPESNLDSNSQFWSQNMEGLDGGMCQYELDCSSYDDDFNIPEVEMTFRNFEDLLGSDEDLSRALSMDDDDKDMISLGDDDYVSGGNSHARSSSKMNNMNEGQGVSVCSLIHAAGKPTERVESIYDDDQALMMGFTSTSMIRPSYSASLSFSHLNSSSSGMYMDGKKNSANSSLTHRKSDDQEEPKKRKKPKVHERSPARKGKVDMNKRIKNRFAKLEVSETKGCVKMTRSF